MSKRDLKKILGLDAKEIAKQNFGALGDFWLTSRYLGHDEADIIKLVSRQCENSTPEQKGRVADVLMERSIDMYRKKGLSDLEIAQKLNEKNFQKNETFGEALFTGEQVRKGIVLYQKLIQESLIDKINNLDVTVREAFESGVEGEDGTVTLTSRLRGLHTVYHQLVKPSQKYTYNDVITYCHTSPFDLSRLNAALVEVTLDEMILPQIVHNKETEESTIVTLTNRFLSKIFRNGRQVIAVPVYGFIGNLQNTAREHLVSVGEKSYNHCVNWAKYALEAGRKAKREFQTNMELQNATLAYARKS